MNRGRYCELIDLGAPYGIIRAQLTKPRSAFTVEEWAKLVDGLRDVNAAADRHMNARQADR